tara:strand:+ start:374 stop:523 length:150 start_codon:yes stop_codon:yes gene_type:complete
MITIKNDSDIPTVILYNTPQTFRTKNEAINYLLWLINRETDLSLYVESE